MVLRGYTRTMGVACSSYGWNLIPIPGAGNSWNPEERNVVHRRARTDLPEFKGGLLDFHLRTLTDNEGRRDAIADDDAAWIQRNFETFNRLSSETAKFLFALEAAMGWRFAKDQRTATARIWSGIEAIYGISSELVYRIPCFRLACWSLAVKRGRRAFEP